MSYSDGKSLNGLYVIHNWKHWQLTHYSMIVISLKFGLLTLNIWNIWTLKSENSNIYFQEHVNQCILLQVIDKLHAIFLFKSKTICILVYGQNQ